MDKKEKKALKLLKQGKFTDAIDVYNEIAHDYQKDGEFEKAIEMCEKGSSLSEEHHKFFEGSFCERLLSELHAQLGNRDPCLTHLKKFRQLAKRCNSLSQEQLSYHVEGWCLLQLYTNEAAGFDDLRRALKELRTGAQLVDNFKKKFHDGDPGGSPRHRKAAMLILEAQILEQLNRVDEALERLVTAEKLLSTNDKTILFELRRTRCSMAPVERRLDLAELMDDEAPEDKKGQAICELSHQCIIANRLKRGYEKLVFAYMTHSKNLTAQEMEDLEKRLCILYRLVHYEKILKNSRIKPKISLCELHEAIGDLYDKYYQTMVEKEKKEYRHFVKTNIVRNYEKMIEHKRDENDELRAYLALALVYGDLNKTSEAMALFEKRLAILARIGASEDKIMDTRISILDCMCKLNLPGVEPIFEELNEKVVLKYQRKELYETWAKYWTDVDAEAARKWRNEADKIPDIAVKNEDDETDVLYGTHSDEAILNMCLEENEWMKVDAMSEHQMSKKNDKGETVLHREAMESNWKMVEKLCKKGCNVNAKDNGGWTPLSEAVAHEQLENVRVLIRYGADVNARSAESFVSEEPCESSKEKNHTLLTPLMDACTNGYVDIARTLMENGARIDLKDSEGWTALEHLRNFIAENDCDKNHVEFEIFLQNEMERCNFPIKNQLATSSRRNRRVEVDAESSQDSPMDEEEECLILDSVASRKRRNSDDFNSKTMKRRPRSGENLKPPTVPSRKLPRLPSFSSSQGSPRRSMSPTMSIRSAPSIYGKNDDIQVVGVKKNKLLRTYKSISPRVPAAAIKPSSSSPHQNAHLPRHSPRAPGASFQSLPTSSPQNDTVAVKCSFEMPAGCTEKMHPVMLPMPRKHCCFDEAQHLDINIRMAQKAVIHFQETSSPSQQRKFVRPTIATTPENVKIWLFYRWFATRSLTIGETKIRVLSHLKTSKFKKMSVWKKEDVDKCLLDDELLLSHLPDKELALVFQLIAPSAYEVYQETKDPIAQVCERLQKLSTDSHLDLSWLCLEEGDFHEVTRTLRNCERPAVGFSLDLSFCDLSIEDETNLSWILPECSRFTLGNTSSRDGFWKLFEKSETRNLKILEMTDVEFKDESQLARIVEKCEQLTTLKLARIQFLSGDDEESTESVIASAIRALPHLKNLDLSFNSWISVATWHQILGGLENLEELTINEIWNNLQFESDWLPNLRYFTAHGSIFHWESLCDMLSILGNLKRIDVRYTKIDKNLVELLRNETLEVLM